MKEEDKVSKRGSQHNLLVKKPVNWVDRSNKTVTAVMSKSCGGFFFL